MNKKFVAPIIVTAVIVLYSLCIVIGAIFFGIFVDVPLIIILLITVAPIITATLIIYMLIQRINEIKGGEEDEARKY